MPVPRGEDPSLDHLMQLMEHDQLSAMIVGHLVIVSLLVKFLEMQPGADAFGIYSLFFKKSIQRNLSRRLFFSSELIPAPPAGMMVPC
jgi:hypothetical protein